MVLNFELSWTLTANGSSKSKFTDKNITTGHVVRWTLVPNDGENGMQNCPCCRLLPSNWTCLENKTETAAVMDFDSHKADSIVRVLNYGPFGPAKHGQFSRRTNPLVTHRQFRVCYPQKLLFPRVARQNEFMDESLVGLGLW